MKIPIVREDYLVDCMERKKKLPFDMYKVEMIGEASSMVTIKVKGQSAVHDASGLQDSGHILEEGKSIYNTTLNMSDLSTGINRLVHSIFSFSPFSLIFLVVNQGIAVCDSLIKLNLKVCYFLL
jgi:hypothetical protein